MRIRMRLLLGTLVGLVMVLGLVPGMALTAYAETYQSGTVNLSALNANDILKSGVTVSYDGQLNEKMYVFLNGVALKYNVESYTTDKNYIVIYADVNYENISGILDLKEEPVPVTGVKLNPSTATLTAGGDPVALTATVEPAGATDRTVKWSVGGTDSSAVTLYSDATCDTPVELDKATETLT